MFICTYRIQNCSQALHVYLYSFNAFNRAHIFIYVVFNTFNKDVQVPPFQINEIEETSENPAKYTIFHKTLIIKKKTT